MTRLSPFALSACSALFAVLPLPSQDCVIDFETLPSGTAPADQLLIGEQYNVAPWFTSFSLVGTGSLPEIAKPGAPATAFQGVFGSRCGTTPTQDDMPLSDAPVGCAFLTDGDSLGVRAPLRIDVHNGAYRVSFDILDIDGSEEWTIRSYDSNGNQNGAPVVIGTSHPDAGDARATRVRLDRTTPIHAVELHYTGTSSRVGLAFDNFCIEPPPPCIDFESFPAAPGHGDFAPVDHQYDVAPWFVQFSTHVPTHPVAARLGMQGWPPSAFFGPTRSACGSSSSNGDTMHAGEVSGCYFLTVDSAPQLSELEMRFGIPPHSVSFRILDVDGPGDVWDVHAYGAGGAAIAGASLRVDTSWRDTGDGRATQVRVDAGEPIHSLTVGRPSFSQELIAIDDVCLDPAPVCIDFESYPTTANHGDGAELSDEFDVAPWFVDFELISTTNDLRIAQVGAPATAFAGVSGSRCGSPVTTADMVGPEFDVGCYFFTTSTLSSFGGDALQMRLGMPVRRVKFDILDLDGEQWEVRAFDAHGVQIGAPQFVDDVFPGGVNGGAVEVIVLRNEPIHSVEVTSLDSPTQSVGFGFDNVCLGGVEPGEPRRGGSTFVPTCGDGRIGSTLSFKIYGISKAARSSLLLGFSDPNREIGGLPGVQQGSRLRTTADVVYALTTSSGEIALPIPADPGLLGISLFAQSMSFDTEIVLSDGVRVTLR